MSDPLPFRWWQYNRDGGMHTLCLLDIKVSEPDYTSMTAGKVHFTPTPGSAPVAAVAAFSRPRTPCHPLLSSSTCPRGL